MGPWSSRTDLKGPDLVANSQIMQAIQPQRMSMLAARGATGATGAAAADPVGTGTFGIVQGMV
jgi:hypothetical protein